MGLTTGGAIGAATAKTLDECVPLIQAMHDAAKRVNPDILVLCHGGPIAEPDDAAYVIEHTEGVVGFFGASSMERLPTEVAMTENMRRFKSIPVDSPRRSAMSTFVKQSDVEQEQFDWGTIGWRCRPANTGAKQPRRHGRDARAGRGARVPPARRPGGDDHRQAGKRSRSSSSRSRRRSAPGDSVYIDAGVVHASYNDGDETAHLQVVIGPSLGEGGYGLVDVSGEEPWASLR